MNIAALMTIAIEEALEELERNNIIKIDNNNNINRLDYYLNECSICFDNIINNNHSVKKLSCENHFVCNECWNNYVKSRIGINHQSNTCFICYEKKLH